jgi:CRISPR/Cas system-associated exonuclease Cas4 (RecB family)
MSIPLFSEETIDAEEKPEIIKGEIIERYLKALHKQSEEDAEWYSPDTIHVTDLIPECERAVILSKLFPRAPNIQSLLYMEDGRSKHAIVLADKHEFRVEWKGIRASIDDYDSIRGIIIEKKTTYTYKGIPRRNHIQQLHYYAAILQDLGYEVRKGVLLYIKRTMDELPIEFDYDLTNFDGEAIRKEMLKKANNLKQMIKDRVLPKRNISYYCLYCGHSDLCFKYEDVVPQTIEVK